jgi:flagellin-like protein
MNRGIDMKRDNAFTGLEAAIVLIAFVVVAAVFSYVMLGAGFFATQKAQEVTYAGIKQATSNVVFEGAMYSRVAADELTGFTFSVKVPGGGMPVDMSQTTFIYTSTYTAPPLQLVSAGTYLNTDPIDYPTCASAAASPCYNGYFPAEKDINGNLLSTPSTILYPGNVALYTVSLGDGTSGPKFLGSEDWFSLEMIPQIGAATLVNKRLDAGLQDGKALL